MKERDIIAQDYEKPLFVPLQDVELLDTNGGGLAFILFAAVTIVAAVAIVNVGAFYNGLVGASMTVSEYGE